MLALYAGRLARGIVHSLRGSLGDSQGHSLRDSLGDSQRELLLKVTRSTSQ